MKRGEFIRTMTTSFVASGFIITGIALGWDYPQIRIFFGAVAFGAGIAIAAKMLAFKQILDDVDKLWQQNVRHLFDLGQLRDELETKIKEVKRR